MVHVDTTCEVAREVKEPAAPLGPTCARCRSRRSSAAAAAFAALAARGDSGCCGCGCRWWWWCVGGRCAATAVAAEEVAEARPRSPRSSLCVHCVRCRWSYEVATSPASESTAVSLCSAARRSLSCRPSRRPGWYTSPAAGAGGGWYLGTDARGSHDEVHHLETHTHTIEII